MNEANSQFSLLAPDHGDGRRDSERGQAESKTGGMSQLRKPQAMDRIS